jgi:hypothetical protein
MSHLLLVSPFTQNGAILEMRQTKEPEVLGTAAGHTRWRRRRPGPRPLTPHSKQSHRRRHPACAARLPAPVAPVV